jgi:K+ transporter
MSRHWWTERKTEPGWIRKLAVNAIGCIFTALILVVTVSLKLDEGGWVIIAMTGGVVLVCYMVRRHYAKVSRAIDQLEAEILPQIFNATAKKAPPRDLDAPTAALLVNGFNGLGLATLTTLARLFDGQFKNVVFISVGEVDSALLRTPEEVQQLESKVADDLSEHCGWPRTSDFTRNYGPRSVPM